MPEGEQEKNRALVESLRASFTAIARRLTPDVEPAVVYSPGEPVKHPEDLSKDPE